MAQIIRFDGGAQHDRLLRAPAKSTRRAAEKAPVRGASVETKGLHSECELKRDGKDASAPLLKWGRISRVSNHPLKSIQASYVNVIKGGNKVQELPHCAFT